MIRRRRLIITPGPGRQLPDPEDPSLPQVSPHQPEPPLPQPPRPDPPAGPPDDDEPRDAASSHTAWLRALGVETERDSRRAWLEPHLWAALRARVDAGAAERRARWSPPGPAPLFR